MSGFEHRIYESAELCPNCGKPISYGELRVNGTTKRYFIKCVCEAAAEEIKRIEKIANGENLLREAYLQNSGLGRRQLSQTFDNFTVSSVNKSAFDLAVNFSGKTGLILSGNVGSGKTHLASAIAHEYIEKYQIDESAALRAAECPNTTLNCRSPVCFVGSIELFERLRSSYKTQSFDTEKNLFKSVPLLIIDDIGVEQYRDWKHEQLFDVVNNRYSAELPLILTTNCNPKELREAVGDRIYDRLKEICQYIVLTDSSHRTAIHCS